MTPPVKKIESLKGFGNRWEGATVQIFNVFFKGVGVSLKNLLKRRKIASFYVILVPGIEK